MIRLYEVRFQLENGSALNVLMAAGSADEAKGFAHDTLRAASEPRHEGDVIQYNWHFDEITVSEVMLASDAPVDCAGLSALMAEACPAGTLPTDA